MNELPIDQMDDDNDCDEEIKKKNTATAHREY